jgi:deoxyribonuclease-4
MGHLAGFYSYNYSSQIAAQRRRMRPFGVHMSIAGGVAQACVGARALGISAMQMFSRNPRGWHPSVIPADEVKRFREEREKAGLVKVAIHCMYLLNLAAADEELYAKSRTVLGEELRAARELGVDYVVTHMGSHRSETRQQGIDRLLHAIDSAWQEYGEGWKGSPILLLEICAGGGNLLGTDFGELSRIIGASDWGERLGITIDSAHAFGSGYDIRLKSERDRIFDELGKFANRVRFIHLNDSMAALGSHRDRHQHLGKGEIGLEGLRNFLWDERIQNLPAVLETPLDDPHADKGNLAILRELISSKPA